VTTPALAVVSELNSSDGPPSPPRAGPTPRVTGSHITHINEHPADTDTREITTSRIYFCKKTFNLYDLIPCIINHPSVLSFINDRREGTHASAL
jgi:hypothetical protein